VEVVRSDVLPAQFDCKRAIKVSFLYFVVGHYNNLDGLLESFAFPIQLQVVEFLADRPQKNSVVLIFHLSSNVELDILRHCSSKALGVDHSLKLVCFDREDRNYCFACFWSVCVVDYVLQAYSTICSYPRLIAINLRALQYKLTSNFIYYLPLN